MIFIPLIDLSRENTQSLPLALSQVEKPSKQPPSHFEKHNIYRLKILLHFNLEIFNTLKRITSSPLLLCHHNSFLQSISQQTQPYTKHARIEKSPDLLHIENLSKYHFQNTNPSSPKKIPTFLPQISLHNFQTTTYYSLITHDDNTPPWKHGRLPFPACDSPRGVLCHVHCEKRPVRLQQVVS